MKAFRLDQLDPNTCQPPIADDKADRLKWAGVLPPVMYLPLDQYEGGKYSGFCPNYPILQDGGGEVVLSSQYLDRRMDEDFYKRAAETVYLHEIAHRLTPGEHHGPIFGAVNAALHLRALGPEGLHKIKIYDVQDCENPGDAIAFAVDFAKAQEKTEASAQELPRLASEAWIKWSGVRAGEAWAEARNAFQERLDAADARWLEEISHTRNAQRELRDERQRFEAERRAMLEKFEWRKVWEFVAFAGALTLYAITH